MNLYQILLTLILSKCTRASLLTFNMNNVPCNSKNEPCEKAVKFVSDVAIKMASAHDVVLHYDDSTGYFIDLVCKQIGMYNVTKRRARNLHRTNKFYYRAQNVVFILNRYGSGSKLGKAFKILKHTRAVLHIVILSDAHRFENSFLDKMRKEHIALYVCINQKNHIRSCLNQDKKNFDSTSTLNLSNVLSSTTLLVRIYLVLVLEITDDSVRLFKICFFCGQRSKKLTLMRESKLDSQNEKNKTLLLRLMLKQIEFNYHDFEGHAFRVAFPHHNIYVGCENEVNTEIGDNVFTECSDLTGIEGRMLKVLSKKLNFNYWLINPKFHTEIGPWKNMLKDVLDGKVDFAFGSFLISEKRLEHLDFSIGVGEDPMRIVYISGPDVLSEGQLIVFPFHQIKKLVFLVFLLI